MPRQVMRLDVWEIDFMLRAVARRDQRAHRFQAAMTANLMNCWIARGHRVTVDDLAGPMPGAGRRLSAMTPGERQKWLEDRRAARAQKK